VGIGGRCLKGEHRDFEAGDTLTVTDTLLVIHHDEAVVDGVRVPDWYEVRVEQCPVWMGSH
jgi:hypothetical protein